MARYLGGGLFFLAIIAGSLYIGTHHGPNTGKHELKIPLFSSSDPKPAAKDSMVLPGNFAKALAGLRSAGAVRVHSIRVEAGRVDADVLGGSRYVSLEVKPGGGAKKTDTSNVRADPSETRPLEAVNAAAPQRIAREGARRLHLAFGTLNYVVYDAEGLFGRHWNAYFKNGAVAMGDKAGRLLKAQP